MCVRSLPFLLVLVLLLNGGRAAVAQRAAVLSARHRYWDSSPDSLRRVLAPQRADTARLRTLRHLLDITNLARTEFYAPFATEAAALSARLHRPEVRAYRLLAASARLYDAHAPSGLDSLQAAIAAMDVLRHAVPTWLTGTRIYFDDLERPGARQVYYEARLVRYQPRGDTLNMAACQFALGYCYGYRGDFNRAVGCCLQAAELYRPFRLSAHYAALAAAGEAYAEWGNPARAQHYIGQALAAPPALAPNPGFPNRSLAQLYLQRHDYPAAWQALVRSRQPPRSNRDAMGNRRVYCLNQAYGLALQSQVLLAQDRAAAAGPLLRQAQHLADSLGLPLTSVLGNLELDATWARYYAARGETARAGAAWQAAYRKARQRHSLPLRLAYLRELARHYQQHGQYRPAAAYGAAAALLADTLEAAQGVVQRANYEAEQAARAQQARIARLRLQQAQQQGQARQQRTVGRFLVGGLLLLLALAVVLYTAFRRSERLKRLVTAQKQDLQAQRDRLDQSLTELRTTQRQLIQQEKMASLGELTAGIAHEIQNPLNFVTNFSEVSTELVAELQLELAGGNPAEAQTLANDLAQNLHKIHQHGQRASSIVHGMLEHSRRSSGERRLTDLNALCDEHLRLAYHGQRSKNNAFNAELQTAFAPDLPWVEAVPGDVGRVLLNLLANAFYAVQQRQQQGEPGYRPTVSMCTRQAGPQVEIRVADNGTGMPVEVQQKIFQPFFTTKPPGAGTGLGLSLAYDIITQGHGGSLSVESQPGQGSTFCVALPVNGAAYQPAP